MGRHVSRSRRSAPGLALNATRRERADRPGNAYVNVAPTSTSTPQWAIAQAIRSALDPTQAPGKVRTMADMTPEELARLVPPRKAARRG